MKSPLYTLVLLAAFAFAPVIATAADSDAKQKDQEVLGTLSQLNKNEVAAAKYVEKNKATPPVKKYAQFMIKEHTANLDKGMAMSHKLGKPVMNDDAAALKKDGEDELAALKESKGKDLDKTYIDDMVKDHQAALDLIDNKLLPAISDPKLKKFVEDTRKHVEHHLEEAKALQSKMN